MPVLLRLLLLVPLGFVVAAAAAGMTVAFSIGGAGKGPGLEVWMAVVAVWAALYAGAIAFLPWLVAVVVAEGFGLRSVFYWLAVGGAVGGAAFALIRSDADLALVDPGTTVALAAGFVGGFAYWLVAGRLSGTGVGRSADGSART